MATAVCNGITNLSYKLYEILSKNEGNIVFCPFSLHTILSLAYQGASEGVGANLEKAIGITGAKKAADGYEKLLEAISFLYSVKVYSANKVFAQSPIKEDFSALATKSFFAEAESVDLSNKDEAVGKINSWVEEKTESRIKDLASASDFADSPNLVLVNTISFKGDWTVQFEEADTKKQKFFISETDTVDCDMMHADVRLKYGEDLDLDSQILCVSYENESIYFMIFLPRVKTGLKTLETQLQNKPIPKILQNMDFVDIALSLPKFTLEAKSDFKAPLSQLELDGLFNNADFPGVSDGPAKVKIIQKTHIAATEQGTDVGEAGFVFGKAGSNQRIQYRDFNADHPFLFMLMYEEDGNRCVLLSGRVVNPVA